MGGRLALLMALNHPEQFSSVVVESASPGLKTEYERSERVASDRKIIERLRTQTMAEFLSGWYSQPLFDSIRQNSARFQKLLKDRSANKAEGLCKSLEYMGTGVQPPLWDKLSELNLPGLLIVGADDNKFKSIAGEMAKRSETISARIIDGSGHNVHFEKPQEFAFELQKFLR